jgi:hypothetical protein
VREFLGFLFNSIDMTVSLTPKKKDKLKNMCLDLLRKHKPTIRLVAQVIGTLVSSFPGVLYGPLYNGQLERDKSMALKSNAGNFDRKMELTHGSRTELDWWIENITEATNPISHGQPDRVLYTDASGCGYGFIDKSTGQCGGGE